MNRMMKAEMIAEKILIANMDDKETLDIILEKLYEKNKTVAMCLEQEMAQYEQENDLCPECWSDDIESKIFCRSSISGPEEYVMKCNECGCEL
jgi:hypothetical protein